MTSNKSAKPPTLVDGIDVRSLPIGPEEAFVLSRVDGNSSPSDIALATGLDEERVATALVRLTEIGAILFDGAPPAERSPEPVTGVAKPNPDTSGRAFAHTVPAMPAVVQSPPPYDPSELSEDADLTEETKRRVLETYYLLEDLTHYELLRVARDADKKAIKASYYEVVNTFHPDRYFGKKLGSFKSKMEAVFTRITLAHDTLTRLKPREEYDKYLASQLKTRDLDAVLEAQPLVDLVVEARPPVGTVAAEPAEQAMAANALLEAGGRATRASRPTMRRASDPEVRRRALARKLRTSGSPGARISGTMKAVEVPVDKEALKKQVEYDLRARYEKAERAPAAQVQHYVKAAEQAVRDKDPLSAANALRIASQLAPEDDELRERLAQAQEKAASDLADTYLEQAQYEEREGRHLKAAQSYERAALGKRSSALYEHAATCLLEGGGELKRAADLAKKAVELSPDQASYHVTLSRVYAAAKMLTSATAEAEKAVKLAPENESAKKWLKRVKRGEI